MESRRSRNAYKRVFISAMGLLLIGLVFGALAAPEPARFVQASTDVFLGGEGGYHTYRIPAMAVTKSGVVLAFCEGRKNSPADHGNIDLLIRRSLDNGHTWSEIQVVYEDGGAAEITVGNPCPVVDHADGTVWLAFTRNNERAFVTRSTDDGATWSSPVEITDALRAFPFPWTRLGIGTVNGIQLQSGRLVMPLWLNDKIGVNYRSAVILSDDHGATWKPGGLVPPTVADCNECTVAETEPDVLCINLRNKDNAKRRAVAWSRDGGLTWSEPILDHALIDPVCQGSLLNVSHEGKPCLVFSNASSTKRERLTVRASADAGQHWSEGLILHSGPAGYSCLTTLENGLVACLFEAGDSKYNERLVFATFALNDVLKPAHEDALTSPGVALTFDDAYVAEWAAAIPLFERYGAHATFFVSQFDKLTAEQIEGLRTLQAAGHAIGCHSLRHRKAVDYVNEHSVQQYLADEITPAVNLMLDAGLRPTAFAYPNSSNNAATDDALLRQFRHLRSGAYPKEGERIVEIDALFTPIGEVAARGCLYGCSMDRAGEPGREDVPQQIREALERAKNKGELVVLYSHNIGAEPKNHITPQALEQVLRDTQELGLKFYTYDELP